MSFAVLQAFGLSSSARLKKRFRNLDQQVAEARILEELFDQLDGDGLGLKFDELRLAARGHATDESLNRTYMTRAAAIGASAIGRIMGFRLHDVQVKGALATAQGAIIEMQTGEGKTMVCGLAALIRSVFDSSVHVATTNAYLAERDHETFQPIFNMLGTTSAFIGPDTDPKQTRRAYRCNITYAPGYTFGFDYLRDQLKLRELEILTLGREVLLSINGKDLLDELLQTGHHTIIVDEADSVLIDESTTPLLLSGPPDVESNISIDAYKKALASSRQLVANKDYTIDRLKRIVELTESGLERIHEHLHNYGRMTLNQPWPKYVENAIYSETFLIRDENYVVDEVKIKLVDQFTGRIFDDRNLRAGLHQALEAKEGLPINPPNKTLARITRQRFFQLYDRVCGMTGTASGSQQELAHFYNTPVVELPPNRPNHRIEIPERYFDSCEAKLRAIVQEVVQRHANGAPMLIGTGTIRDSLRVREALEGVNVPCVVLNGIQDLDEAEIISAAGKPGSVCIATNMAGRGTDIKLDNQARAAGGLHVLCTQRHDSRRVDQQLAGRSARQGDPGTCQFFIAADDPLLEQNAPAIAKRIIASAGDDGECHDDFSIEIEALQLRIEQQKFEQRRRLVQQDNWLDMVRETMVGGG